MRTLAATLVLSFGAASMAPGQWYLGLELAANTYRGSSADTSASHMVSRGGPGGGSSLGLVVSHSVRRVAVALRLSYANPGFAVSGNGVSLTDKTTGRLYEIAAWISTRVGGIGPSGAVRAELGPALHLWDVDGSYRTRLGALAAAAYEWPVSSRFNGTVRVEGLLSPSWLNAADVPLEFARRVTWRYGVGLGLRYRLT